MNAGQTGPHAANRTSSFIRLLYSRLCPLAFLLFIFSLLFRPPTKLFPRRFTIAYIYLAFLAYMKALLELRVGIRSLEDALNKSTQERMYHFPSDIIFGDGSVVLMPS